MAHPRSLLDALTGNSGIARASTWIRVSGQTLPVSIAHLQSYSQPMVLKMAWSANLYILGSPRVLKSPKQRRHFW